MLDKLAIDVINGGPGLRAWVDDTAAEAGDLDGAAKADEAAWAERSEAHTSELQSLMRISYAVLCLKNKQRRRTHPTPPHNPHPSHAFAPETQHPARPHNHALPHHTHLL